MIKLLVIFAMIGILISLGSGLWFMIKDREHSNRLVKSLTWRIGLSILLFVFIIIAVQQGWVTPGSIARSINNH